MSVNNHRLFNGSQSGSSPTDDTNGQFDNVYTASLRPADFRSAAQIESAQQQAASSGIPRPPSPSRSPSPYRDSGDRSRHDLGMTEGEYQLAILQTANFLRTWGMS
jgi:hypothetical protein